MATMLVESAAGARPLALLKQVRICGIQWFLLGLRRAAFMKGQLRRAFNAAHHLILLGLSYYTKSFRT
jgi:hypothetical protein